MRQGSTLQAMAQKLADIRDNQHDYAIRAEGMGEKVRAVVVDSMSPNSPAAVSVEDVLAETEAQGKASKGSVAIELQNGALHRFAPTNHAQGQIADFAEIPAAYLRRISAENPQLAVDAINHGFKRSISSASKNSGSLLRTHGGNLRALLSSRYRPLDNYDLFEAVAPHLIDLNFRPEAQELTERRMYIKVVSPKFEGEVVVGSPIQFGLVISNSDVGAGTLRVEPLIYVLACENGAIRAHAIKTTHLGRNLLGLDDVSRVVFEDETKRKTDAAYFAQVRDVVKAFTNEEFFRGELAKLQETGKMKITNYDFPTIVERTAEKFNLALSEKVKTSIIDNLASGAHGAGHNLWGVAQGFTYAAGNAEGLGFDEATDLERVGGKILDINKREWDAINAK